MHTSSKKGKAMACRIAISFAAVAMGISCIATHALATCKFKAKKDIIVILDVGHTDKDSGQISARGVKEYDFNMNLARRVLEELVNTGLLSTQMIVMSGSNTHESRLQRSKRANDLDADLFMSIHHDGVKNETRMPSVLFEAGMIVNRAEEQVLSSPARRATVAKAVAEAVKRFCAVKLDDVQDRPLDSQ